MKKESLHKLFALVAAAGFVGFSPVVKAEDEESPLGLAMEEMSSALKSLRRLERDPERWTKSAAVVHAGGDACIKAMSLIPKEVEAMKDGPEKTKAIADVRRFMALTLAAYAELELAFLAEDEAKVDELKEKLSELKADSHEKYNKEE
jgi:hypothetical protein